MKTGTTRLCVSIGAAFTMAMLPGCSQGSTSPNPVNTAAVARHPISELEVVPLTVTSGTKSHAFQVEIARTGEQQSRGLMFREQLGPNEGMIFPYNPPRNAGFWMKNVPIPLDIIFIGPDGRIMNIAANTQPQSTDTVYSDGPASLILEIPGGRAAELGIGPGDRVER